MAVATPPTLARAAEDWSFAPLWHRLRAALPEGRQLPADVWEKRHRVILGIIFVHAAGLTAFGLYQGWGPAYSVGEGALIAGIGLAASWNRLGRRFRSAAAALAAATTSAVLTQFWGGYIEGHFHYFVMVAVIALYQDWVPFLLMIFYVAADHGAIGSLAPEWVYNHPAAIAHPWTWAVVHATLVLGECTALLVLWNAAESARARTDLVLNSASDAVFELDALGRITYANPAAARLTGHKADALRGRSLDAVLRAPAEATGASGPAPVAPTVGAGPGRAYDWTLTRSDGALVPIDWASNPIEKAGAVTGSVVTVKDATDRKRVEDERRRRVEQLSELQQLKEMDRFKTLFINTAAHELHTPLTPLRLQVHVLKEGRKGALTLEQKHTVDVLERNVERLSHLVEDVLDVARLQGSTLTLERRPTDLGVLAREAVETFQETAKKAHVALDLSAGDGLTAEADGRRLTQVFYNLIGNAIKFTPAGGRVRVEANRLADAIQLRVADTGVGLRTADIAKLFQPFAQVHDTMEKSDPGSGLGLYICKGIVELHGGYVSCESAGPGHGTTFSFVIPLHGPA